MTNGGFCLTVAGFVGATPERPVATCGNGVYIATRPASRASSARRFGRGWRRSDDEACHTRGPRAEAGHQAVQLLNRGIANQAIGIRHGRVFNMPIIDALSMKKNFDREMYNLINKL